MDHHVVNREPVSSAMQKFIYRMTCTGLRPSGGMDGRQAWRRKGEQGMSLVVYNSLDPKKPDLAQPCRLAMEIVSPDGEVVLDILCTYPSSAEMLMTQLAELTDAMAFYKPSAIEGYQPPNRLVLADDPDFYMTIVPNERDTAPDARPAFAAYGLDTDASALEALGEFTTAYRALGVLERASHDRRHDNSGPRMGM